MTLHCGLKLNINGFIVNNIFGLKVHAQFMCIPYSGKVWRVECLANLLFLSVWRKKVWRMNRSAKGLSMVGINLDGFSLANRLRFAKFAKLSPRQTFPLYGNFLRIAPFQCIPHFRNKFSYIPALPFDPYTQSNSYM